MYTQFKEHLHDLSPEAKEFFRIFPDVFARFDVKAISVNKKCNQKQESLEDGALFAEEVFIKMLSTLDAEGCAMFFKKTATLMYFWLMFYTLSKIKNEFDKQEKVLGKKISVWARLGVFEELCARSSNGSFFADLEKHATYEYNNFRELLNDYILEEQQKEGKL